MWFPFFVQTACYEKVNLAYKQCTPDQNLLIFSDPGMRRLRTGRTCAAGWQEFICQGEADFRFEVPEKEAHCRHSAAGARLLRETHHDELQPPVHYKVMKL